MRLRPALAGYDVVYATVEESNRRDVPDAEFHTFPDANKTTKIAVVRLAIAMRRLVRSVRPSVVITTGAAPGYFALRYGDRIGARTIWVDSIANAHQLSLSGRLVRDIADIWLTQWSDLEQQNGPYYVGSVL
ncbi:MAG: UDP-N-acetylglucosamine--LPS N-acetylglucosamine transferase [bacterium]